MNQLRITGNIERAQTILRTDQIFQFRQTGQIQLFEAAFPGINRNKKRVCFETQLFQRIASAGDLRQQRIPRKIELS